MTDAGRSRPRGRPRTFDEGVVLDGAIAAFSAAGFTATAITDLTQATGLTAGSLYKAYRDKEGVFARALSRYVAARDVSVAEAIEGADSGRERIARLLALYADLSRGEVGRRGCMVVAGIAEIDNVGAAADLLRATLARRRAMLAALVEEGRRDGSVTTAAEPGVVADLLLSLLQGMRVVGKGGLFGEDSGAFVGLALKVLD